MSLLYNILLNNANFLKINIGGDMVGLASWGQTAATRKSN